MPEEKIAMVGTPCQIIAATKINKYSNKTGGSPIDVKIGLFCMENFSYAYLKDFLAENNIDMNEVKEFRIEKGQFKAKLIYGDEFSIPIIKTKPFTRKNCNICTDYTSNNSDISVGSVGSPKGWSTLIVRTEKGKKIIDDCLKKGYLKSKPITENGLKLLQRISNKKIQNNLKIIDERESVGRQVLSHRVIDDEDFEKEADLCQFNNLEADVISVGGCVLCGACEYVCPENIVEINNRKPQKYGKCREDCHACYYACPRTYLSDTVVPLDMDEKPLGDYIELMSVNAEAIEGQDGGAVSSILVYLLESGSVDEVFLVGQDEDQAWKPKSYVTNRIQDVVAASGTKYSTVPVGFKALKNKKVNS
ncbi:MAG: Coenzyme F420 hydrogenase/dehydrogenase, beta subunit C-terminal domain [Methanobacteriaceae archaeon]|nr:Coenzyme F420 hydrogenase/dehydrogenase, beta subunit C-terminal domain [Methanobacteriaceae archaeon]